MPDGDNASMRLNQFRVQYEHLKTDIFEFEFELILKVLFTPEIHDSKQKSC